MNTPVFVCCPEPVVCSTGGQKLMLYLKTPVFVCCPEPVVCSTGGQQLMLYLNTLVFVCCPEPVVCSCISVIGDELGSLLTEGH